MDLVMKLLCNKNRDYHCLNWFRNIRDDMESETNNDSLITLVLNVQIIMCHQNELCLA
jgi:hypothetical protein